MQHQFPQRNYPSIEWLDLGCGTGYLEEKAKNYFSNAKYVLVDPSEQMLEQAKEKLGTTAEYFCTDSASIEFKDRFNVVTAIQSHHYMQKPEREKATENVYRALKKDGIYISFENVIPEEDEIKQEELLRWEYTRLSNMRLGWNSWLSWEKIVWAGS